MQDLTASLCESIDHSIRWQMPDENGETRAEYFTRFNQSHKIPDAPELPANVEDVWEWLNEISSQRHSGPEALTWADFKAWADLTATDVSPDEIRMLVAMDRAYRVAVGEVQKEQMKRRQEDAKMRREMKKK